MTRTQLLLISLIEECDEVSQRATKALSSTLEQVQPGQDLNNAKRLVYEFNDLYAVMMLLYKEQSIPEFMNWEMIGSKIEKIEKYLKLSGV